MWGGLETTISCKQISHLCHCVKSVQIRSLFWSVFSRIRTDYGEIRISPYSVEMRVNTHQNKLRIWTLFTQWWYFCQDLKILSRFFGISINCLIDTVFVSNLSEWERKRRFCISLSQRSLSFLMGLFTSSLSIVVKKSPSMQRFFTLL